MGLDLYFAASTVTFVAFAALVWKCRRDLCSAERTIRALFEIRELLGISFSTSIDREDDDPTLVLMTPAGEYVIPQTTWVAGAVKHAIPTALAEIPFWRIVESARRLGDDPAYCRIEGDPYIGLGPLSWRLTACGTFAGCLA
jgi:hypothetical protein